MASDIIDSLVTQLEYSADTKVIDKADKKLKQLEKQSKATASATDSLAEEQLNLAQQIQNSTEKEQKLRREQSKLRKEIKATKKPTDDQRKALAKVDDELDQNRQSTQEYRNELKRLGIQQAKIAKQQRAEQRQLSRLSAARRKAAASIQKQARAQSQAASQAARAANQSARALASSTEKQNRASRQAAQNTARFFKGKQSREVAAASKADAAKGPGGMAGLAAGAAPVTAALAGVTAAATVAAVAIGTVVETGARMETLRARLKTVEGGVEEAAAAFSLLRGIAVETPFELEDVTNAYVRLKSLGIQPTEKSLKAFGNVAAAQGKPIIDFIEAVADAATGEFERLKEFGIKASSQGDQVAFTMGGITTKIGKNAAEITEFLQGLGETRFAGAMADQMNTFAGQVSNLKDRWTSFLDQISQLGVLDEVKAIIKELSGAMGEDLAPIIADVMVSLLRQLRDLLVFLKGDSEDLSSRMAGLAETFNLLMTLLQPFLFLWKATVAGFGLLVDIGTTMHGMLNTLIGFIKDLISLVIGLITPTGELTGKWEGLSSVWAGVVSAGDKLVGTVSAVTNALFGQAGSLKSVNDAVKEFQALTGAGGLKTKTDAELQALRQKGGKETERANEEIRRRVKQREEGEKQEEKDTRKKKRRADQSERATDFTKDFSKASDRQLSAFASDPNVSQKLRTKAEKEQDKRDKKRRKKGASAGKKLAGATLIADINKQIDKNARELAQAETARKLRGGTLTAGDAGSFETQRFKEIRDQQRQQFQEQGRLPAGIAQDVRQIAALPSINDLAGRVAPPVISNTINNFEFRDNEIIAQVMGGEFATSPGQVATLAAPALSKELMKLLGEAVPNFRTQEVR